MRSRSLGSVLVLVLTLTLAGCGGTTLFRHRPKARTAESPAPAAASSTTSSSTADASAPTSGSTPAARLGFPDLATQNTTRVDSPDPVSIAAAVALAVFPSAAPGTHPAAVTLTSTDSWQAAVAAASLMAPPFRAPILLSPPGALPSATSGALRALAPTGASSLGGAQVIRIGDVPSPSGLKPVSVSGSDPYSLAAGIDSYEARQRGRYSVNVVIASADSPQYAMPAAGYAAESGEPVLYVSSNGVPTATAQALVAHHHPHIYVLGPPSVVPQSVMTDLAKYGPVTRISASSPAAESVAFTEYRDPACAYGQPCVHIPGSFGWAIRSPGHGYVLLNESDPLYAAAAAALSSSGSYGPQLLVSDANNLPKPVLNYFLNFATPGYTGEGPTAAVYNHAWIIGSASQISVGVQAEVDTLLEAVQQK